MATVDPRSLRMTMLEDVNRTIREARELAQAREARQAADELRKAARTTPAKSD